MLAISVGPAEEPTLTVASADNALDLLGEDDQAQQWLAVGLLSLAGLALPSSGDQRSAWRAAAATPPPSPLRSAPVRAQDPHHRGVGPQFGRRTLRLPRVGVQVDPEDVLPGAVAAGA